MKPRIVIKRQMVRNCHDYSESFTVWYWYLVMGAGLWPLGPVARRTPQEIWQEALIFIGKARAEKKQRNTRYGLLGLRGRL